MKKALVQLTMKMESSRFIQDQSERCKGVRGNIPW